MCFIVAVAVKWLVMVVVGKRAAGIKPVFITGKFTD